MTESAKPLTVHTDGASRGNPGPAGIGVVLLDHSGAVIGKFGKAIGRATNNQAEYLALIEGLETALKMDADTIAIKSDSELMVRQVTGEYAVRSPDLKPLFDRVTQLLRKFRRYSIAHVPREQNRLADAMANKALDGKLR